MEVNWVQARAECSLRRVFETLFEMVESDVETANGLKLGRRFQATYQHKKIIVTREENDDEVRSVVFELSAAAIRARAGKETELFSGRPRLNESGECLLEVDGRLHPLWQIRQRALEDLFFG